MTVDQIWESLESAVVGVQDPSIRRIRALRWFSEAMKNAPELEPQWRQARDVVLYDDQSGVTYHIQHVHFTGVDMSSKNITIDNRNGNLSGNVGQDSLFDGTVSTLTASVRSSKIDSELQTALISCLEEIRTLRLTAEQREDVTNDFRLLNAKLESGQGKDRVWQLWGRIWEIIGSTAKAGGAAVACGKLIEQAIQFWSKE